MPAIAQAMNSCDARQTAFARASGVMIWLRDWAATSLPCSTIAQRIGDAIVSGIISISTSVLTECKVGASIGVLLLPDERVGSPEDALLIADALMYEVKRNGKGACRLSRHAGIVGVVSR